MIITTYCTQASGVDWTNTSNVIGNTSSFTVLPNSWADGRLYLWDFEDVSDSLKNPKSIVTSVVATITVQCTGTADSTTLLKAGLTYNGTDLITDEQYIPAGYPTATEVVLTFSCEASGKLLQRYDLRSTAFGLIITPVSGLTHDVQIQKVKLEVNCNQEGFLLGESSLFPISIDSISSVTNSESPFVEDESFVVKSELVNQVGDAIIKVQRLAALDSDVLRQLGNGVLEIGALDSAVASSRRDVYLLTAIVTGVGLPKNFHTMKFETDSTYGDGPFDLQEIVKETSKYTSGHYSTVITPSALSTGDSTGFQSLVANYVSCVGWTVSSGVYYPLQVTGNGVFFIDWDNNETPYKPSLIGHWLGFRCVPILQTPGGIYITSDAGNTHLPVFSRTYWQSGVYTTGATFVIRITALLVEQVPSNSI